MCYIEPLDGDIYNIKTTEALTLILDSGFKRFIVVVY